jgi:hypothetical protein
LSLSPGQLLSSCRTVKNVFNAEQLSKTMKGSLLSILILFALTVSVYSFPVVKALVNGFKRIVGGVHLKDVGTFVEEKVPQSGNIKVPQTVLIEPDDVSEIGDDYLDLDENWPVNSVTVDSAETVEEEPEVPKKFFATPAVPYNEPVVAVNPFDPVPVKSFTNPATPVKPINEVEGFLT